MSSLLVVKIGGNVIDNPHALSQFLQRFASLPQQKILIHGGGKIATQVAAKLGVETQMVEGRRITDQAMLDVVTMVYGGLVNKNIVAQLQSIGANALGLTGADAGVIRARKRAVKEIDYGFVGDVEQVNAEVLAGFVQSDLLPVIAPLTFDASLASMLNTNADTMASAVAAALASRFEVNLVYCFEKKGVLSNPDDDDAVIPTLTPTSYANYKATGVINKGMIPKLDNAFAALQNGVSQVTICHADELTTALQTGNTGTKLTLV
ncbi:MAG: acetylglutamate kinase [Spirosomaceae bacterium]|jgi:acetylglutamate kinase|nr:acetylglutamate kinase [Spirosomataceae bacterium]